MKYTYVSPETEVVRFNLETAFLASDVTDALGTDLGDPDFMDLWGI
jgi:hypothetical protein